MSRLKINNSYVSGWSANVLTNKGYTSAITWNTSSSPLTFEGESLSYTLSGCTAAISYDTNFSGGQALKVLSDSVGDYVELTVPNVPAGTYEHVQVFYKSLNDRGQYQASIDGVNQGAVQDQYGGGKATA